MRKLISFLCVIALLLFSNCTDNNEKETTFTQELIIGSFKVNTPPDWNWKQDQGIDTFIGRIMDERDTIYFDQGYLSFGGLERVEKSDRNISFESLRINGDQAILEKERVQSGEVGREIRLSIYIDAGDNEKLNRLYIFDPKDEETVLEILKSHRFN